MTHINIPENDDLLDHHLSLMTDQSIYLYKLNHEHAVFIATSLADSIILKLVVKVPLSSDIFYENDYVKYLSPSTVYNYEYDYSVTSIH